MHCMLSGKVDTLQAFKMYKQWDIQEAAAHLSQLVKLVQGPLKEMANQIALHGRHIVQLHSNRSLKRFESFISLMKACFSDVFH